jgi:cytochrome c oxidase subunit 2
MITFLIFLAIILAVTAIVQMLSISDLISTIKGRKSFEVTEKENKIQAFLWLIFVPSYFIFILWQYLVWGKYMLPESASVHGDKIDGLFATTWSIIIPVFIITHCLLAYFCFKYVYNKDRKAAFFAHNNKLELAWTVIPSITLATLILYGLNTWNTTMSPIPDETDKVTIELFARQFDWTARYAGNDEKLGRSHFKLIKGFNALGIDSSDASAHDDILVKGEFHLPVNKPVQFVFRSQDVIHSAYMPHFRAQMNCVPGMATMFNFIPKYTSAEMKQKTNNENFEYILLCNKICGAAHYNMQMKIIVESEEDYNAWLSSQKKFLAAK